MSEFESPPRYEHRITPLSLQDYSIYTLRAEKGPCVADVRIVGIDSSSAREVIYPLFESIDRPAESILLVGTDAQIRARAALDGLVEPDVVLEREGLECYYAYMHIRMGGRVESWDLPCDDQLAIMEDMSRNIVHNRSAYTLEEADELLNVDLDASRMEAALTAVEFWSGHARDVVVTCPRSEAVYLKDCVASNLAGFTEIVREEYEVPVAEYND